ncbi:MAG: hypothetical protein ATN35_07405 [Epulopiscium sp. Nele67-Bin004]|nr:MAG: hypothetical protein ATN35_07405 [Epulopiscium sp. Nele67-Bin004]
MKTEEIVITSPSGIHARPAGELVKAAGKYESTITLSKNGKDANAKRLIAILGLAAKQNETVTITVDGSDEEAAFAEVKEIIANAH